MESAADALVVPGQFDCGTCEVSWVEAERSKGHYRNTIASQLELLEPLVLVSLKRGIVVIPEQFMGEFVGNDGLKFADRNEAERLACDEQDCPAMQGHKRVGRPRLSVKPFPDGGRF